MDHGIVLHRTELMPPTDSIGVTPAAALLQHAATTRRLDVIRIGDRLLATAAASSLELTELAATQSWRPGADSLRWCVPLMNPRSASVPETDCRVYLVAAGLPEPLTNVPVVDSPDSPIGDLWLPEFRLCIEHEGRHHFTDAAQVKRDVWRYSVMRDLGIAYAGASRDPAQPTSLRDARSPGLGQTGIPRAHALVRASMERALLPRPLTTL
ncbi:MAG: hypothetical protein ACJ71Z_02090 [Aeromicrobium sp.]